MTTSDPQPDTTGFHPVSTQEFYQQLRQASAIAENTPSSLSNLPKHPEIPSTTGAPKRTDPFTAWELFDILQAALEVKLFQAKHGEKGECEEEMATRIKQRGVQGSKVLFKTRLNELLVWHQVCAFLLCFKRALTRIFADAGEGSKTYL
jgi:hypothetical protein